MNRWVVRGLILCSAAMLMQPAWAADAQGGDQSNVSKARQALAKKKGDSDSTKQLEQVFEASQKNYSLLKAGHQDLTYAFDYTYTADQRIDLKVLNGQIYNLDVTPSATHEFDNSFSYDYGLLDNLTIGTRIPLISKYDSQSQLSTNNIGDISFTTRWQPLPYVPGKMSTTLFGSLTTKTGVSPYEIDVQRELSTGSGYYSVSGGASFSKVLDPVVLFGSTSLTYNKKVTGLNQVRGAELLTSVDPGLGISGSGGFAYSLSYDISLSMSVQLSYSDKTTLEFSNGAKLESKAQMNGFFSLSLGTRVSDTTIINTSLGIGLTPDAPDFSLGVSLPINIEGLKK